MPLTPYTAPEGRYDLRAEAMTLEGERIFCVKGEFDVTTAGWLMGKRSKDEI